MRQISNYVHSKHKAGVGVFVGPRTFTNAKRRWQIRIIIDLPFAPGAEKRQVVRMTMMASVSAYWEAVAFAKDELGATLVEHKDWTDFTWQVWAPNR